MKKHIHSFILIIVSGAIYAQKIELTESPVKETTSKVSLYSYAHGYNQSVFAILLTEDKTIILDKIDSSGQVTTTLTVKTPQHINILSILPAYDKAAIVFSVYQPDKKTNTCYYSLIENITVAEKYILLSEITHVQPANTGRFHVITSNDKQYFAVIKEHPFDRTKNEQLSVCVYSTSETKKIWCKDYVLDVMSRINPVNVFLLSNKGEIFAVKKEQDKTNYKYILYCFNKESSTSNARTFSLQGKYISDIFPIMGNKGEFILAGFYSAYNYTDYEGYFIYRFNNSMQPVGRQINPFGSIILSNIIGKKAASKEGASLTGFMLENIVQRKDGGLYFLSEKNQIYNDKTGNKTALHEDIFILSTDADGNALGANILKKKQETGLHNEKYTSFNYWLHNDSLNIIYNKINFDEEALKLGKKNKADEFGVNNFAGTNWFSLNYKCEINKSKALSGLFKDANTPMAINTHLLTAQNNRKIILLATNYMSTKYKYIILTNY